jgi:hypothetical protein
MPERWETAACGWAASSTLGDVRTLPAFDCDALFRALDTRRQHSGLGWYELAHLLWQQSSALNEARADHPLCGGAVQRLQGRGSVSCQYALFMLRWLGAPPEDFLAGPVVDVGDTRLPEAGPDKRLRWDLNELHGALNEQRGALGLSWVALGRTLDCTSNRLTNLRNARIADMGLAMRCTQWLGSPAAVFIHPATW